MKLSRTARIALVVYVVSLAVYASSAGSRLLQHTNDNHFAYQAQMFLQRRLDLGHPPPNSNDWAEVEYLHLRDGRTVAGTFVRSSASHFRELDGTVETILPQQIANRWKKYYVSFPPFPAVIFLPFVALFGLMANDVLIVVFLAALAPALVFVILRRLAARGDSARSEEEDLWLTAMFAFGTVYFYSSVQGSVWYAAHVVATVLSAAFILCALDARRPLLAGACLGAILLTRPHIAAWGILFVYEAWRARRPRLAESNAPAQPSAEPQLRWNEAIPWRPLLLAAIPLALFAAAGIAFNLARFGAPGEFGHYYLNVRWTDRIQRYGLTNVAFLARNLSVMLTLTPKFLPHAPWLQLPWHGLSLLLCTPAYLYVLWPRTKSSLHTALWLCVAPIAIMGLLYQNDGWVQFGYRFSNDFAIGLILLLAIGGRPLTRAWMALIVAGMAVNLFGAITFGRMWQFYWDGFFPISPNEY